MADILGIGRSGLLAFQKALGTIGHNIANVNTPGYSRQSVSLSTFQPEFSGGAGFLGRGVNVSSVRRSYNGFVVEQIRTNQTAFNHQQTLLERSGQLDRMLGDPATGLAAGLQDFFDSVQQVASDPTSSAARQVMLSEGQGLVSRFKQLDQSLDDQRAAVHSEVRTTVAEINTLAASLADVNENIVTALGQSGGDTPNDLLDRRDVLVEELSQRLSVSTSLQDDGALNVFIGTGQSLVIGGKTSTLTATPLAEDAQKLDIALVTTGASISVRDFISGGTLGGLKEFTDRVLDPAKNTLGLIAVGMASAFNDQHNLGIDLDGAAGQDFFVVPGVEITADPGNPGTVSLSFDDVSQLTADEYELRSDGLAWSLTRSSDGQAVPFASGTGTSLDPFLVNGLSIVTPSAAAAAGERYLIRPTRNGAGQIDMALTDNRQIAAAGLTGDVGDNSNALQLANMQQSPTLLGGTASFNDSYSALVADVATKTHQAEIGSAAQQHLLEQSQLARETVSGVNLDEEAADLLRFEQAYQAAAQVIAVADTLFDELLNAVRG